MTRRWSEFRAPGGPWRWLRGRWRGERLAREIDDELSFHLEMRMQEYVRGGMTPGEARRAARRRFGDRNKVEADVRRVRRVPVRKRRGTMLESVWQDVRFALRGFARAPMFFVTAVVTLALGIGANTAIFGVVYSALLEPLPFEGGDRMALAWVQRQSGMMVTPSHMHLAAWRGAETIEGLMSYTSSNVTLTGDAEPESVRSAYATAGLLSFLGVPPVVGRDLVPADTIVGSDAVLLLNEEFWRTRFDSDPDVVGSILTVDQEPHVVIGVAPSSVERLFPYGRIAFWMPLNEKNNRRGLNTVVRMQEGVTTDEAQAELAHLVTQSTEPDLNKEWKPLLIQPNQMIGTTLRTGLWVLLGAVGLVLLIACANVANMLLARGVGRRQELAVRTALGGGGLRLARQLMTESLLLSMIGAAVGIGLAYVGLEVFTAMVPEALDALDGARVNGLVLSVGVGLAVFSGLVFGAAPALQVGGVGVASALGQGVRSSGSLARSRLRQALVAFEVAVALVLFLGAGLLLNSLRQLQAVDPGFDAEHLAVVRVALPRERFSDATVREQFYDDLLSRIRQLPAVTAATVASGVPPEMGAMMGRLVIDGVEGEHDSSAGVVSANWVSPEYFSTLGLRFRVGGAFGGADDPARPVVVNEAFVREFWGEIDQLGKRFRFDDEDEWSTVVGVVDNVRAFGLADDPDRAQLYYPSGSGFVVLVRAGGDPADLLALLRGQVYSVDPSVPVESVETVQGMFAESIARPRFNAFLLTVFAALAVTIALIGVYGVIALAVNQRVREIGVRIALGAQRGDVQRLMIGHGMRPVLIGLALGVAVSYATARFLENLLFQIEPTDPVTYATVLALMTGVALLAGYLPSRRVARVDPVETLRQE